MYNIKMLSQVFMFGIAILISISAYPQVEVNLEVEQRLIQEFGQERTEIRDGAVLIMNGAYAPEPYIVERRGLNLYLNGQPISTPWEHWPIPDPELIEENPSEPPNGGNPITFYKPETKCEAAHAFWNAKEMYYIQHFPKEEATRRLVADLEKASQQEDADWKVRYNPAYFHEGCFDIVSADGEAISWGLGDWPPPPKPTNEELLQDIRGKYESQVRELKTRHYYISVTKGDSGLTQFSEPFLMIFDLMMTDLPYEQRLEKAKQSGYKDWEGYYPHLLRTIEPAPELLAKIARIRADFEKKKQDRLPKTQPVPPQG